MIFVERLFKRHERYKGAFGLNRTTFWHIFLASTCDETLMPEINLPLRQVKLFCNNRNQAIRNPAEFELPGDEALISQDDDRLIIEPLRKKGLAALLDSWAPSDDAFPEIADPPPAPLGIF